MMTDMGKVLWFGLCAVMSVVALAKAPEKGAFGTAFQDLAGDDQANFVATVNRSMTNRDEPLDDKSILTLYRVNRDAVKASPAADRKTVLAAVFATAPLQCLPYFTDHLAEDLFTRKAAGFREDDDSFVEFASAALMRISLKLNTIPIEERPGARSAFAVIMFLKASEGKPEDLREAFMMYVRSGSHVIARKVWFPAAFGDDNQPASYQPILDAKEKGEEPPHVLPLPIATPQLTTWLRGEGDTKNNAYDLSGPTPSDSTFGGLIDGDAGQDSGLSRVPRPAVFGKDSPYGTRRRGDHPSGDDPGGYMGQTF